MIFADYPGHTAAAGLVALTVAGAAAAYALRAGRKSAGAARIMPWLLAAASAAAAMAVLLILWNPSATVVRQEDVKNTVLVFFDTSQSLSLQRPDGKDWLDAAREMFKARFRPGEPDSPVYRIYGFDGACYPCDGLGSLRKWGSRTDLHRPMSFIAASSQAPAAPGGSKIVGAVVLTDGQSEGKHPETFAAETGGAMKLAIIGVGPLEVGGDLSVASLRCPVKAALDTNYEVQATVSRSGKIAGEATVELLVDGRVHASRQFPANSPDASRTLSFDVAAAEPGEHSVTVRVAGLDGEANVANNAKSTVVQVTRPDNLKVLLVAQAMNSEVGKVRSALEHDEKVAIDVALDVTNGGKSPAGPIMPGCVGFPPDQAAMNAYDVIILGPCRQGGLSDAQIGCLYRFVVERGGGLVFMPGRWGREYGPKDDSRLRALLPVEQAGGGEDRGGAGEGGPVELTLDGLESGILVPADLALPHDTVAAYGQGLSQKPAAAVLAKESGQMLVCAHRVGRGRVALVNTNGVQAWYSENQSGGVLGRFMSGLTASVGRLPGEKAQIELFAERLPDQPDKVRFEALVFAAGSAAADDAVVLLHVGEQTVSMESSGGGKFSADVAGVSGEGVVATVEAESAGAFLGERTAAFTLPRQQGEMDRIGLDREFLQATARRVGAEYMDLDKVSFSAFEMFPAFSKAEKVTDMTSVWRTWPALLGLCSLLSAIWFIRRSIGLA